MNHELTVDSVILTFSGKRILQDVYLKLEQRKILGLLGRNGAGKTCLMKIMFGKLTCINQSVRLNGKTLTDSNRNPNDMMYLPQFSFIPKRLTVSGVFRDFGLDFSVFTEVFPSFANHYHSKFKVLSSGEQRVLEVYLILCSNTKFCLLDEPFSQVAPVYLEKLKALILSEKKNKGILVSDHLYAHVTEICDDLIVLKDGTTHQLSGKADLAKHGYVNIS